MIVFLQVTGYEKDDLATALKGADLVVIPAGVPRKPGMTRDDLFNINAGIVKTLVESIAEHAPNVRQPAIDGCIAVLKTAGERSLVSC